jgi:Type IV secretion system pilin
MFRKLAVYIGTLGILAFGVGGAVGATIPTSSASAACGQFLTFPAWYRGLSKNDCNEMMSPNEVGGISTYIWTIVLNIIEIAVQVVGYLAIFYIIYGGFRYITSAGAPEAHAAAMKSILNAVIGLAIAISAIAIVRLMARFILGNASSETGVLVNTPAEILNAVLNTAYFIAGAVAVVVIIVSGFNFVTSSGNAQKVAKARMGILYAVIGLVVIIFASVITSFIQGRFS